MIDIHSHILPNIDDGANSLEESIEMIKEAKKAGFTSIVTTSHFIEESYNASPKQREDLIHELKKHLKDEGIDIQIYNGAEVYISDNLKELLESNALCTINYTKYLLIELPMNNEIIYLNEIIDELQASGIIPIIAHPERYSYVQKNPKILNNLIKKGVLFQGNYGSIIGYYGASAKKAIRYLLKNNMIHFLGTDAHRDKSIYNQIDTCLKKIERTIGKEKLNNLSTLNPKIVINNETF